MELNPKGKMAALASANIAVHQERCAMVRNRNAQCLRCAQACTSGCIRYEDNELYISPEKCIGCGTCATVCPTCALEARNPNDVELLAACEAALAANGGAQAVVACEQALLNSHGAYDPAKVVRVTCLGRVEESLLAGLAAAGADEVVLVHGACGQCAHHTGRQAAEAVVQTVNSLFGVWGSAAHVVLADGLPSQVSAPAGTAPAIEASQPRGTGVVQQAEQAARESAEEDFIKVMRDGTLPHYVPDRRDALLDALAALGQPGSDALETRLWGHVNIDRDKCLSCRMCAVFCPTGAITKFDDEDGTVGIEHTAADCVRCNTCEVICPGQAIHVEPFVNVAALLDGQVERLTMPGRSFEPGNPHSMYDTMKRYHKGIEIYER